MTDQSKIAGPEWIIEEPGLLRLATTEILIRFRDVSGASYHVERAGVIHGASTNVASAKEFAMHVLNDMLLMGIDP